MRRPKAASTLRADADRRCAFARRTVGVDAGADGTRFGANAAGVRA